MKENKIVSVYELLGLIKDGKAPKKIKFDNTEYILGNGNYYYRISDGIGKIFTNDYNIFLCLNEEVEILEEDKSIIEKIEIEEDIVCNKFVRNEYGAKCYIETHDKIVIEKLNQVIDYINEKENDN